MDQSMEQSKARVFSKGLVTLVIMVVAAMALLAGCGPAEVTPKATVEEYSWDELSRISAEIAKADDEPAAIKVARKYNLCNEEGKLDGTQVKSVELSDGRSYDVQVAGFAHDEKTDGGKAGITFIFKDAIAEHEMNSSNTNFGGWEDSEMRSWLATDVMSMLPKELQDQIVSVEKKTNNLGETEDLSSITQTSDKLWLFSTVELRGEMSTDYFEIRKIPNAEGSEYKLFRDEDVTSDANGILVKYSWAYETPSMGFEGGDVWRPCYWWERTPNPVSSEEFMYASSIGQPTYASDGANLAKGVVPGFCI